MSSINSYLAILSQGRNQLTYLGAPSGHYFYFSSNNGGFRQGHHGASQLLLQAEPLGGLDGI